MNIKKELYDLEIGSSCLSFFITEFLIISLFVWFKFNFLTGIITYISLIVLLSTSLVKFMAWLFVVFWTFTSCLISYSIFSLSTTFGVTILTFLFSAGIHFYAYDLTKELA
jgi:hypothetical protein